MPYRKLRKPMINVGLRASSKIQAVALQFGDRRHITDRHDTEMRESYIAFACLAAVPYYDVGEPENRVP